MKYLVRSAKYFIYLLVILAVVILALVAFKVVDSDISAMFVNGYDSLWQIAAVAAFFSLIYPRVGFTVRKVMAPGSAEETAPVVKAVMEGRGYELEKSDGETMTFRKRSPVTRALKMWEDRISFEKTITGYDAEGLTKDLVRIVSAIEARYEQEY
ncbi:MAG: hypothetical protein MJY89_04575 [Bacteroidales bacterium]|nr:hypothetical protein [Bacteroidales bacterium]